MKLAAGNSPLVEVSLGEEATPENIPGTMPEGKSLTVTAHDGILVVRPHSGLMTSTACERLHDSLALLGSDAHVIINFEGVNHLTPDGIAMLLNLHGARRYGGQPIRLCCLNDEVREVFSITDLDRKFHISETVQEAVKKLSAEIHPPAKETQAPSQ